MDFFRYEIPPEPQILIHLTQNPTPPTFGSDADVRLMMHQRRSAPYFRCRPTNKGMPINGYVTGVLDCTDHEHTALSCLQLTKTRLVDQSPFLVFFSKAQRDTC